MLRLCGGGRVTFFISVRFTAFPNATLTFPVVRRRLSCGHEKPPA